MNWAHFDREQIRTQVGASFSPFGHPAQVNTSINLVLATEIQGISALKCFFFRDLRFLPYTGLSFDMLRIGLVPVGYDDKFFHVGFQES